MLRKYLTPEQLEAVSNVNGIVRKMRYGLKEELDEQHTQATKLTSSHLLLTTLSTHL